MCRIGVLHSTCFIGFIDHGMSEPIPKKRLTKEQRQEATRRVLAGEKQVTLAAEFGVTRAYISLLKAEATNPERYRKKHESQLTRKLTETELERLKEAVRTSSPIDYELQPPILLWDAELVRQLAARWFEKNPSARVIKECLQAIPAPEYDPIFRRPQPPKKHHISQLPRDLAENDDYVQYYLSPAAERLAQRQYELALADWIERFGDVDYAHPNGSIENADTASDFDFPMPAPTATPMPPRYGQRSGKHSKGKSVPKRKKRKGKSR